MKNYRGFTLVEVIIALAISTIGVFSLLAMQTVAIKGNNNALSLSVMSFKIGERAEKLLNMSSDNYMLQSGMIHDDSGDGGDGTVQWSVEDDIPIKNSKTIEVTTNFFVNGKNKNIRLVFVKNKN